MEPGEVNKGIRQLRQIQSRRRAPTTLTHGDRTLGIRIRPRYTTFIAGLAIQDYLRQVKDDPEGECWGELFMKTWAVGKALQKLGLRPRVHLG